MHDKTIRGIKHFKKEIKLGQFTDDTTLLVCKILTSIGSAVATLADFGAVSGLH